MERLKNDMDDFIIDGRLSIKELYELAKSEGFEDRTLFFSIRNPKTRQHFSTHHVVDFGKGWTRDTAIMHLTWEDIEGYDASPLPDDCSITLIEPEDDTNREQNNM